MTIALQSPIVLRPANAVVHCVCAIKERTHWEIVRAHFHFFSRYEPETVEVVIRAAGEATISYVALRL